MITVKLEVGDVLMGKHYGDLLVKGFQDEETINGIDFAKSEYISRLMNGSIILSPVIPAFAGFDQTEKYVE